MIPPFPRSFGLRADSFARFHLEIRNHRWRIRSRWPHFYLRNGRQNPDLCGRSPWVVTKTGNSGLCFRRRPSFSCVPTIGCTLPITNIPTAMHSMDSRELSSAFHNFHSVNRRSSAAQTRKSAGLKVLRASKWDGGIITEGVDPNTAAMDYDGRAFATAAGYVAYAICRGILQTIDVGEDHMRRREFLQMSGLAVPAVAVHAIFGLTSPLGFDSSASALVVSRRQNESGSANRPLLDSLRRSRQSQRRPAGQIGWSN